MTGNFAPFLAVGAALFVLGAVGFVTRRNLIMMMLSAELMLHGVSLTLLSFGQIHGGMEGQIFTVFVLTVSACEAGLSLSIILSLYQRAKSLDVELWSSLKEADLPPDSPLDDDLPAIAPRKLEFPSLTGAGSLPMIDADAPLEPQVAPLPRRKKSSFRYGEQKVGSKDS